MKTAKFKTIIGRAESIIFLIRGDDTAPVPAKVDTGAFGSSVWATRIEERDGVLSFVLFDEDFIGFTGETINTSKYSRVRIENSFGESEYRYRVDLKVVFCGKKFTTSFTLADRSKKIYPVLVGRKLLKGRFVVDVAGGHPIADEDTEENLGFSGLKNRVRKQPKQM